MNAEINRRFLESVVPWPGSQDPGFINMHVNMKNTDATKRGGKPFVVGWPYRDINEFINRSLWVDNTDKLFNVWICMSRQSEDGKGTTGKPKAIRLAHNATWVKSIWIDCDVKPKPADHPAQQPWLHYETLSEARAALDAFIQKVGLPPPSAVVNSGGGLHVYWISDKPLTPDEWRPYAESLKAALVQEGVLCDTGLTTDIVRLLRVPGTLNHKYAPPRLVEVVEWRGPYDFSQDIQIIKNYKPLARTQHSGMVLAEPWEPNSVFDVPDPAFAGMDQSDASALQDGIEKTLQLIDPRPVFAKGGCPWLRDALRTGGKDFDNPQWNLSVLCTAFMENGDAIAHQISQGHPTYSSDDTQALYDRKVAERRDRGIGYPSCATIKGAGGAPCETCPHFPKGKSPLNIRSLGGFTATVKERAVEHGALLLPENYDLDVNGKVCLIERKIVKGEVKEEWFQLFHNKIFSAHVRKNPDVIYLHISTDKGNTRQATLRFTDIAGPGYEKKLAEQGIKYVARNKGKLEDFFMSFMEKMHEAAEAQETVSFGWYRPKGPIEGFAFGGVLYRTSGEQSPSGMADTRLAKRYEPTGSVDNWHHVASYVLRQGRPEFDVILATAFAAPLMELTGTTGAILASVGERGAGKSYALEVGAAVWGHPKLTVEGKTSTERGLMHKLGSTNNLPAWWDEVSDPQVQQRFLDFLQQFSIGVEGSRLTSNITQQDRGTWTTIVNINGNKSFRAHIVQKQKDHGAGLRRVLEYWTSKDVAVPKGQVAISESERAHSLLTHNYGMVGQQYAAYLATNLDDVEKRLKFNTKLFEAKLNPDKEESMWLSLCAVLLTGAELANELPRSVGFDCTRMLDFLVGVFLENRKFRSGANVNANTTDYAEDYLAQYLKDRLLQTIWTKGTPSGVGRAPKVEWRLLQPNASLPHGVNVRWDEVDLTLRFSKANFEEWCTLRPDSRSYPSIVRALENTYAMKQERKMLCSGTPFKVPQEWVFVIDVRGHQDLLDIMNAVHAPDNSALGSVA